MNHSNKIVIMKIPSVGLRILGAPTGCVIGIFFNLSGFVCFPVHQDKSLGISVCYMQHLFRNKGISLRNSFDLYSYIYFL